MNVFEQVRVRSASYSFESNDNGIDAVGRGARHKANDDGLAKPRAWDTRAGGFNVLHSTTIGKVGVLAILKEPIEPLLGGGDPWRGSLTAIRPVFRSLLFRMDCDVLWHGAPMGPRHQDARTTKKVTNDK